MVSATQLSKNLVSMNSCSIKINQLKFLNNLLKLTCCLFFVFGSASLCAQHKSKAFRGILFYQFPVESKILKHHTFLKADIDTTISLEQNLERIAADTLRRLNLISFPLSDTSFSKIETKNAETLLVAPVELEFGEWVIGDQAPFTSGFVATTTSTRSGHTLALGYNLRWIYLVKKLRFIELRQR
jgi:hypothetical protein